MLVKLTDITDRLLVYPERMKTNIEASKGLTFSQAVLLALTKKGLTREQAYAIVQRNAMATWQTPGQSFQDLLLADPELMKLVSAREIQALFNPRIHFREVNNTFQKVGIR